VGAVLRPTLPSLLRTIAQDHAVVIGGAKWLLKAFLFLVGTYGLAKVSLWAFGDYEHLKQFSAHLAHKLTAQAMMRGTLRLHPGLWGVTMNDEQVYNGAGFTNWGFGVPLLQIPFHAWVLRFPGTFKTRFFPDRLIFFVYLVALIPLLWMSLCRATRTAISKRPPRLTVWLLAWSATLLFLTYGIYPLISFRFIAYEETVAYFVLAQLYALAFYINFRQSTHPGWLCGVALAAGLGLLIRPTGLPYVALWGALVFLRDRTLRTVAVFSGAAAPLVGFWLYSNWVRSGSPWSLGYQNCLPEYPFHYSMIRFGSQCVATTHGQWEATKWLFKSLFWKLPDPTPEMAECHYLFESLTPGNAPFFPTPVLLVMVGSLLYYVARKRWGIDLYLPHAVFVAMFFAYARAGAGFSYRYTGDFWPLVFLVLVQVASFARFDRRSVARSGLALAFVFCAATVFVQKIDPTVKSIEAIDEGPLAELDADYLRTISTEQPELPRRLVCGESIPNWPRANGKGWGRMCEVDTFTNVYLGVRKRTDTFYKLRFKTDHPLAESLKVYVNGRYYSAHLEPDGEYLAEFNLDYKKLYSPAVMVTVSWTPGPFPPMAKLLEIELS
jgi:hypothetical protein